ncbi:hypothetical protein ACFSJU_16310 [Paradesertivirga mongoliensis]|uniref:Outer membrane protein beta-barrel domain-containing protein n=1 Tax=Paradesertivirga mongoliensis TaxID=2100740 RepID=A0ABW4ZPE2_9SPHI|nr:hypothetical protein [Pedobacter mongoliensis]
MRNYFTGLLLILLSVSLPSIAQTPSIQAPVHIYPRMAGYVGIIHPIVTFDSDATHTNFKHSYTVGMPTGINIWKSPKVGFSFEAVPFVRTEDGVSKMSNFLFHPGILAALGKGYTFVGRAAFETSGRFGFTPILNKVVKRNKHSNYFVAVPLPVRFGNDKPASFTAAFQFGLGF